VPIAGEAGGKWEMRWRGEGWRQRERRSRCRRRGVERRGRDPDKVVWIIGETVGSLPNFWLQIAARPGYKLNDNLCTCIM
jgi:hypothetical protein